MSRGRPQWLCSWPGRVSRYVAARDSESARNICEANGWGRPPANTKSRAWVRFAGYSTGSVDQGSGPVARKKNAPKIAASGRRAELALTIYGLLRLDWPIGSMLSTAAAEGRWKASNAALRDFIANVGAAMRKAQRVGLRTLEEAVEADALAWWWSAREKNLRRRGLVAEQEMARDRREMYRARTRRLRKRKDYVVAIGELVSRLNGVLSSDEIAAEHLVGHLVDQGMAKDDAEDLARRWCRVSIPRW